MLKMVLIWKEILRKKKNSLFCVRMGVDAPFLSRNYFPVLSFENLI
jgi:hypothetical protein